MKKLIVILFLVFFSVGIVSAKGVLIFGKVQKVWEQQILGGEMTTPVEIVLNTGKMIMIFDAVNDFDYSTIGRDDVLVILFKGVKRFTIKYKTDIEWDDV